MKYTREKILYLANESSFGVDVDEQTNRTNTKMKTDLEVQIPKLVRQGLLEEVDRDDAQVYYKATTDGEKELLRLRIITRKSLGKDTSEQEAELGFLRSKE